MPGGLIACWDPTLQSPSSNLLVPANREGVPYVLFGFVDQAESGFARRFGITFADRLEHGTVLRNRPLLTQRRRKREPQIDFQGLHDDSAEPSHERIVHRAQNYLMKPEVRLEEAIGIVAGRDHVAIAISEFL
jgi:hypothetical protein